MFGGANGIGRGGVEALAERGGTIVIADMDENAGVVLRDQLLATGTPAEFVKVDVLSDESVAAAYVAAEAFRGRIDIVVNSAGLIAFDGEDVFTRNVDMLLVGVYRSVRLAVEAMKRAGGGSIINISSIAGITGSIGAPGYGPSKHGVVGLTKDFALSSARDNIRVNAVCPGYVLTAQVARFAPDQESSDKLINETLRVPMGRWGQPDEIGSVIGFLASDESSFMTGAIVVVDGGLTAR